MSLLTPLELLVPQGTQIVELPAPAQNAPVAEPTTLIAPAPSRRLVSMDAYRGLVMVLMASAGLRIPDVVRSLRQTSAPYAPFWDRLAVQTDHAAWVGCTLWDLIQPSFMFMVGTALAFSIASRRAKGQSFGRMLFHAIVRSIVLVLLAVVLSSSGRSTNWTFANVLAQIGLGYTFLFLVAWLKPRWQFAAAILILIAYWGAFAVYPKPAADLNLESVKLPADWPRLSGFASHWDKNTNFAARADQWFLNRFPQVNGKPYDYNAGGYQTLNFVPSLATMIFGLLAGGLLRGGLGQGAKFGIMIAAGLAGLGIGWALGDLGICPIVKRIWTPSWAIFSAGWAFVLLGLFYLIIDIARLRAWAFPLVVAGMNSIVLYCTWMLLHPWVRGTMQRHFGPRVFQGFGWVDASYAPMIDSAFFLLFCWMICWWLYRKNVFVRI